MLKSKTLWFAMALAVLSVVQGQIVQFQLGPQTEQIVGLAIAAAIAALRAVTNQPLSEK